MQITAGMRQDIEMIKTNLSSGKLDFETAMAQLESMGLPRSAAFAFLADSVSQSVFQNPLTFNRFLKSSEDATVLDSEQTGDGTTDPQSPEFTKRIPDPKVKIGACESKS